MGYKIKRIDDNTLQVTRTFLLFGVEDTVVKHVRTESPLGPTFPSKWIWTYRNGVVVGNHILGKIDKFVQSERTVELRHLQKEFEQQQRAGWESGKLPEARVIRKDR